MGFNSAFKGSKVNGSEKVRVKVVTVEFSD
jgi:hypothetical protein